MKDFELPIFKTKSPDGAPKFDLGDPKQRQAYYQYKAGPEIAKLKDYLTTRTFLGIMLAKKGAGKGTYSQGFREIFGSEKITHFSVGDLVRSLDQDVHDPTRLAELKDYLNRNYRGPISVEDIIEAQVNRSQQTLLPTEFILTMIKREIAHLGHQTIFLDGFPRNLDQISYSLFFRDLIGFRDDPDFFILIDLPMAVIDQRIRYRVICPKCQLIKSIRIQPAQFVRYDQTKKQFYLLCENPECIGFQKEPMVCKEGQELGIEGIRERLKTEDELMRKAFALHGIPKILLRNSIPQDEADKWVDDYEITPEYEYSWDAANELVKVKQKQLVVPDDQGKPSISLLPPPVIVSLIKQLADLL